ncbi:MAG: calcium/proton exchanger [Candidatus Latescibacteria bacterium]|nr:calcium/proton exchanger [Candidatus Latescibacterota bacterium]
MTLGRVHIKPLHLLLVFVPVSAVLEVVHADPVWVFTASALAIIPLAGLMGEATEHLAQQTGPGIGGLLNATFGNAAELIIAFMALREGLHDVVKASITGSIIGNVLLVLGLSVLMGGLKYERQTFNRTASSLGTTLLILGTIGLIVPALFHLLVSGQPRLEHDLSLAIAIILFVTYLLSLVFSLHTHKHLYAGDTAQTTAHEGDGWSKKTSILVLVIAVAGVTLMSELLVGAVEHTAATLGMTDVFVGVILVAIIGNAAEHSTAVLVAVKNQMDLAMHIAIGSSLQIALFVAPLLVFVSYLFGRPMDLLFTSFEVVSVGLAMWILSLIAHDGESHWMEGVQLLAVYLIVAMVFYFLP